MKGLNETISKIAKAREAGNFDAIKALSRDLALNGSGVVLQWLYFDTIGPNAGGIPSGKMAELIKRDFGSFDSFWKHLLAVSKSLKASGWGILAWEPFSQRLLIRQAEKHQESYELGLNAPHGLRCVGTCLLSEISRPTH